MFLEVRDEKDGHRRNAALGWGADSYWMLPGYLEGLELAGALPITLPLTEDN